MKVLPSRVLTSRWAVFPSASLLFSAGLRLRASKALSHLKVGLNRNVRKQWKWCLKVSCYTSDAAKMLWPIQRATANAPGLPQSPGGGLGLSPIMAVIQIYSNAVFLRKQILSAFCRGILIVMRSFLYSIYSILYIYVLYSACCMNINENII